MLAATRPNPKARPVAAPDVQKIQGAKATGVREELEELHTRGALVVWLRGLVRQTPGWLLSTIFHMIVLLVLALLSLPQNVLKAPGPLVISTRKPPALSDPPGPDDLPPLPIGFGHLEFPVTVVSTVEPQVAYFHSADVTPTYTVKLGSADFSSGLTGDPMAKPGLKGGGMMDRDLQYRQRRHTPEGRAVTDALRWLAAHQLPDGGWSFDHRLALTCRGKCRNAGTLAEARFAATGLALLPFFGAGQTHRRGDYRATVNRGLRFLTAGMRIDAWGGSLYEPGGRMYSHGIATIALCEAYAMTHDKRLFVPVRHAIHFIGSAQDPLGGGWRYEPAQRGDTSIVGWQIMALKSGHLADLRVPGPTTCNAMRYLDGVQYESGAKYGYTDPGRGSPATTAIGLLCRMYLGWKRDNPALKRGVQWLDRQGPAADDMYYNYYATQVMRHSGGPAWKRWDDVMKPRLVSAQAAAGHEKGSWFVSHDHAKPGGRLYCTAMAAMILEVDYRNLPIYGSQSVEEDFPL